MSEAMSRWLAVPRRHPVWAALAAVLLLIVLLLAFFNWNWVKGPVQRMVSSTLGREFRIDGDLDVDYFPLEVHAERLFLANARWSEQRTMASVEQLDMRVRFWPLLAGRLTIPSLSVDQPYLRLERREGEANWTFKQQADDCKGAACESRVRILQLHAENGRMEFLEPQLQSSVDLRFYSGKPAKEDALAPLLLRGSGTYQKAPFELSGQVDSPLELRGKPQPYRIDLRARAGETQAHVSGTLQEPLQTEDVTVNFEMKGPDLAKLYDYVGVVLPTTPPYALKGRLSRHGSRVSYEDFSGTVGDSDLGGDATLEFAGERMKLIADLKSKLIDFDDLAGFVGGTPGTSDGDTASEEQKRKASEQRASGRLLPATPIRLDRLRAMDADVKLQAARVDSQRLPLEDMSAHLTLDDGRLTVEPLNFGAAGGRLNNVVHLDARQDPARFSLEIRMLQLQLPKLLPRAKVMQDAVGDITGLARLEGQGDSAATVLGTANGELSAIMGPGRMSNLVLEVAGLDIAETLAFLLGKDRQVAVRCAYADFGVVDGVATARSVALDTTDTALLVRGDLSFKDESLDLTLLPRPKDKSPISIRTPIKIAGTFADPAFGPKPAPLLLRGAAVAALASVAPPLALLGLIETGPGKKDYCHAADSEPEPKPEAAPVKPPKSPS